jgi:hypothetical protein
VPLFRLGWWETDDDNRVVNKGHSDRAMQEEEARAFKEALKADRDNKKFHAVIVPDSQSKKGWWR